MIAGMPIEGDRLQTLVGLLLADNPRRQVRLRCDADLPFSRAADLLAVLKTAGMPRSSVLLAMAPTPAARLDFRIAATHGKDGEKPSLSEAQIKRYLEDLQAHGPAYGRAAREQAQRIARQNAVADLIASLEGIEKASVCIDAPPAGGGQQRSDRERLGHRANTVCRAAGRGPSAKRPGPGGGGRSRRRGRESEGRRGRRHARG